MKVFILKSLVLAGVTGGALLVSPVMAGPHHDGEGYQHKHGHQMQRKGCNFMGHGMFRGLNLTDEQKTQIKTIVKAQKGTNNQGAHAAHHQQMQALITAPQFDEATAYTLIEKQQEMHQQMKLKKLESQNKIYNLLTAEQQQKLQQRMEKCANQGKKN
ncbi:MAG: Spy/CpxP family protein refolding chaperone [Shewanella sp.]|nr:Spy/CpxP family protein refolding chaperone [Shewanella sp.]MCF1431303.1 Spy/CpxP family protein refolding chaperone [Shewanella sp.]